MGRPHHHRGQEEGSLEKDAVGSMKCYCKVQGDVQSIQMTTERGLGQVTGEGGCDRAGAGRL